MQAGKLRHRIVIQELAPHQDTSGQPIGQWQTFAERWASVEPLTGREFFAAEQFVSEVTHRITMRYVAGVTPKMRVLYGTRVFNIQSVASKEERAIQTEIMAVEKK